MVSSHTKIIISSCDAFSDCWGTFLHGIRKYWADCPYETFILTNKKTFSDSIVKALPIGKDRGWACNILKAIDLVGAEYTLYGHEDFWINARVDTSAIQDYVQLLVENKADYIRLYPAPEPDMEFTQDKRLGIISDSSPYRASLQFALWRTSVFKNLIRPDENAWEFENNGTQRSRVFRDRFLSVKRFRDAYGRPYHHGIDCVCTAVNKGRWSRDAVKYVLAEKVEVDFSKRDSENWWDDFVRYSVLGRYVKAFTFTIGNPLVVLRRIIRKMSCDKI